MIYRETDIFATHVIYGFGSVWFTPFSLLSSDLFFILFYSSITAAFQLVLLVAVEIDFYSILSWYNCIGCLRNDTDDLGNLSGVTHRTREQKVKCCHFTLEYSLEYIPFINHSHVNHVGIVRVNIFTWATVGAVFYSSAQRNILCTTVRKRNTHKLLHQVSKVLYLTHR